MQAINHNESEQPLAGMLRICRRSIVYAAIFSLCINVLMLGLPIYSLQVLDRVISSHSVETLVMLTIIIIIMFIFYGVFMTIRSYLLGSISEWLDTVLAPELLKDSIIKSSLGISTNASQYQRDLGAIKSFVSGGGMVTMLDAPWSILFFIVIYMINPLLGLLAVIGLVILVGFGIINEFVTRKPFEQSTKLYIKSQEYADIASRNSESVESMGMMNRVVKNWGDNHFSATKSNSKATRRAHLIQSISRVLRMVIQIFVTAIGAWLALQNEMSVGGMIASSILVGRALAPFEGAIGVWKSWLAAREAYARLNKNLAVTNIVERGTMELPEPTGKVQVESLIYTPPKGSFPIIRGVSFILNAGESLGIIGPSGAGKSTLTKIIMGLLPPNHGAVRLDGVDTFSWNREDFGQYVGYLPQVVELFAGSIKDNIARMDKDAPAEKVIEAAKMAGVHDLVLRLPKGYDTNCGSGEVNLSPGQRQRIGLARALYGRPKLVVLDEPNSNLDGEGERALVASLHFLNKIKATYIVVAHRPSMVSMVDKLLVLKDGSVEQFGMREDILKQYSQAAQIANAKGVDDKKISKEDGKNG